MLKTIWGYSGKILLLSGLIAGFGLLFPGKVDASIGTIDMRSTTSENYRCYASSLIMQNNKYDVAVNCVNLIFPGNPPQVLYYIVWATPVSGKNPIKLGDLGKGIARFEVGSPFTALYVTEETNTNTKTPSRNIVMNGGIQPIEFLQRATSPSPTPAQPALTGAANKPADTANLSTKDKLLLALRRAGIAAIIALVAIIGLIFVVTRSRG